jgi:hypothetical protein
MTGMASCREIRQALGVYVLGAIEPAERAQVDEHLATCPSCREELASLAGLPAMLRKVPIVEAERLAEGNTELDADELPSEDMLKSLVARTGNVRRMHRWRRVAAAAAVIVLGFGAGAAVASFIGAGSTGPSHVKLLDWHMVTGTGPAPGVHIRVMYARVSGGTEIKANVTGLRPGSQCQFQVTDKGATAWPLGSWLQESWKPSAWYPASIWLGDRDLGSFQVLVNNKVVASVRAN